VLLENYLEFERLLLDSSLRELILGANDWSSFQVTIFAANRRLANFLSAVRSYRDQTR
jgi:hypothetical protein